MIEDVQLLAIDEVAAQVGMSASRIRYYESRGVLPAPERAAGKRRYTQDVLIERASSVRRLMTICSRCDCDSIDVCRMFDDRVLPLRQRVATKGDRVPVRSVPRSARSAAA